MAYVMLGDLKEDGRISGKTWSRTQGHKTWNIDCRTQPC